MNIRRSPRLKAKNKEPLYILDSESEESDLDPDFESKNSETEESETDSESESEESETETEIRDRKPLKRNRRDSFELGEQPNLTIDRFEQVIENIIDRVEKTKKFKKYPELNKIDQSVKDDIPTLKDIINLNLTFEQKKNLYEKINILDTYDPYSVQFTTLKNDILNWIHIGRNLPIVDNDTILKELEVRDTLIKEFPTSEMIVNSDLKKTDKAECLEMVDILMENDLTNYQRFLVRKEIKEMLNKNSFDPLEQKVKNSDHPQKNLIQKQFDIYNSMKHSDTKYKLKEWIETALSLPTKIDPFLDKPIEYISRINDTLNSSVYGMTQVKEAITRITIQWLMNNSGGNMLALQGSPGVGKTEVLRSLSKAIGRPLKQISLGGMKDSSYLSGHSYTYEGAKPGKIVESIIEAGTKNFILYFDEIDKVGQSTYGQEVSGILTHIIDKTQNSSFHDHYLSGIDIDLSNVFMVFAFNDPNKIDRIVFDRMPVLKVPDYTIDDKIEITKKFVLPKILNSFNMNKEDITFTESALRSLISRDSNPGIRFIDKEIFTLVSRINVLKYIPSVIQQKELNLQYTLSSTDDFKLPMVIDTKILNILLPLPQIIPETWTSMYN